MNRSIVLGGFLILSISAAIAGPLVTAPVYSQRVARPPAPTPPTPVAPVPTVTIATPTIVAPTSAVPVTIRPVIVAPQPQPAPAAVSAARATVMRAIVPGGGPRQEAENPDCSVHRFDCAESCDPLPSGFSSYRDCVRERCQQIEENCLEKLVQELRSRRGDSELTFHIKSNYRSKIRLAFYSQDRDVAWPGSGRVYENNDYDPHTYKLKCNSGETVCYGAWTMDLALYWGVGLRDRHTCVGCCSKCAGQSVSIVIGDSR